MYFKIICLLLFMSYLLIQVNAGCTCADGDTVCLQQCVANGQNCIERCNGDIDCYKQCIRNHWPGQSVSMSTTSNTAVASSVVVVVVTTSRSFSSVAVPTLSINASSSSTSIPTNHTTSSVRPLATFSPVPPTSSTAPTKASNGSKKTFLVPAVAIGVASVTVMVQFFFLARMGTMLFH